MKKAGDLYRCTCGKALVLRHTTAGFDWCEFVDAAGIFVPQHVDVCPRCGAALPPVGEPSPVTHAELPVWRGPDGMDSDTPWRTGIADPEDD